MLQYTLVRSRRKTVAIHITGDALAEVRAPLKMPARDIDAFVASKEGWILRHQALREQRNREKAAFALAYGDTLPLCGAIVFLRAREGDRAGYDGECFFLPPGLQQAALKEEVILIYKAAAKHIITQKADGYAREMGVRPERVRINSAKTRWGSCSGKRSLNFSWRLAMADEDVIDYVVVHELAHIREMNHSPRFWAVVEEVLPDYRQRKRKLKALQSKLSREDWD